MNMDQARGGFTEVAGFLQAGYGHVIGSQHHQARGRMRKLHGQAQRIIGGVDRLLQGLRKKP